MVTKSAKGSKTGRTSVARTKTKRSAKKRKNTKPKVDETGSSERYVRDLLVRGEAKKTNAEGKLPLDATHVITKESPDGTVTVKRVRTKLV